MIYFKLDYIAWKGRYCAKNYEDFEKFISYVTTIDEGKQMKNPWGYNSDQNSRSTKSIKQITFFSSFKFLLFYIENFFKERPNS